MALFLCTALLLFSVAPFYFQDTVLVVLALLKALCRLTLLQEQHSYFLARGRITQQFKEASNK